MEEILNLIAEAGIAIATSHISPEESIVLVEEARNIGVDKVIINHANYWILELEVEKQVELAKKGAFIELVYATMLPFDEKGGTTSTMTQAVNTIKKVGVEYCILSSDLGQPHNVAPVEGLRAFYATLVKKGIREEEIEKMSNRNPRKILGIS
jgi:microsomal dipeptidase-like Zn-dependent dipeptidase